MAFKVSWRLLISAKQLPEPILLCYHLGPTNKPLWYLKENQPIFFQENAFESVAYQISAIMFSDPLPSRLPTT